MSSPQNVLEIKDLHARVAQTDANAEPIDILKGVNLTVRSGETHAIMGPNGSGKSTLSYAIAGHPKYEVTSGSITLNGENVLEMSVDERARAGLFLAMQYPVEVPGVSMSNFLRTAVTAARGEAPKLRHWVKEVKEAMSELDIDAAFGERSVNEASPAVRRSATRSCSSDYSSRRSRSSTRPTRDSTSTRCVSCPRASTNTANASTAASS